MASKLELAQNVLEDIQRHTRVLGFTWGEPQTQTLLNEVSVVITTEVGEKFVVRIQPCARS